MIKKVVVITGASSGLGASLSKLLAQKGIRALYSCVAAI